VGEQSAETVNMIGRDQYRNYVSNVTQAPESFTRQIAATKTKARFLVWSGLGIAVVGISIEVWNLVKYGGSIANFDSQLFSQMNNSNADGAGPHLPSISFHSFEAAMIGAAILVIGGIVLAIGVVLHVVASARTRRLETVPPMAPAIWGMGPRP